MNIPFLGAVLRSILDAGGYRIKNLGAPVEGGDAVTKEYLESHGGAPSDYSTVRQNAATGAAHAAESSVHVTTAEKRKWDAKQDALTPTQLAAVNSGATKDKIDAIDEKLDKADVIDPATAQTAGKAADALAVKTALDRKLGVDPRSGTVVVPSEVKAMWYEIRDFANGEISAMGGHDDDNGECIHIKTKADTDRGLPAGDLKIPRKMGVAATTSDIADATKLTPVTVDGKTTAYTLGADTVKKLMAGTTADLSGITAQDIEDFFGDVGKNLVSHFKGEWSGDVSYKKDDIVLTNFGSVGRKRLNICTFDGSEGELGNWDYYGSEGLSRLALLFGSDNKYLGQTITTLAEASSKYKVVAADKDVADRSIKVYDLTQSGASLPSSIPLPDFPTDGVIDCEVWIVAGSIAPTDVTYGKTIYPRGGEGLTYEANATTIVHLTAVAGQSYYTAVAASFKAQAQTQA